MQDWAEDSKVSMLSSATEPARNFQGQQGTEQGEMAHYGITKEQNGVLSQNPEKLLCVTWIKK